MASFDSQNMHFIQVEEKKKRIERHTDKTNLIDLQWHKYIKKNMPHRLTVMYPDLCSKSLSLFHTINI
jgi:hypothetical protein